MRMRIVSFGFWLWICPWLASAGEGSQSISWDALTRLITTQDAVRLVAPDGTTLQGENPWVQAEGIRVRITKTSNKMLHPKGEMTIPRGWVKGIDVRKHRTRGRRIGLLVPLGAGAAMLAGVLATGGGGDSGGNEWLMAGGLLALFGAPAGYFIGRASDRRWETFVIAP